MDDAFKADLKRLHSCAQRAKTAAERVKIKREEIAKIEAAKGDTATARAALINFEEALAFQCDCLNAIIEHVETSHLNKAD